MLGVSDDTLAPVSFDPTGVFVLAGPPASGRTSALAWLVDSLRRAEPKAQFHYFGSPRSALAGLPGWTSSARTVEEVSEQARTLAATLESSPESPRIVAVIEGISDFLSGPADPALVDLIKAMKRSNHFLIAESETTRVGILVATAGRGEVGAHGLPAAARDDGRRAHPAHGSPEGRARGLPARPRLPHRPRQGLAGATSVRGDMSGGWAQHGQRCPSTRQDASTTVTSTNPSRDRVAPT